MQDYLKNNGVSIEDGTDVNAVLRDMMSVLLEGALDEERNEILGYSNYDYRNKDADNSRSGHVYSFLGVRLILVNDRYDSIAKRTSSDELIVPFKNLINDLYCRDISVKIRSQLAAKCKKGDLIGAFAVYGYLKSSENKNKLIIDEYASEIVKDIFRRKFRWNESAGNCRSIE